MSKFIKLTNFLLNINDIHKIVINPNKYYIHIVTRGINGTTWNLWGSGLGKFSSNTYIIDICKTDHPTDYKIITDWIDKN
jgi:hypothetical protein